jgi:hypothetical protein
VVDAPTGDGPPVSLPAPPPDVPLEPLSWSAPPPAAAVAAAPLVMPPLTEPPPATASMTLPPPPAPAEAPLASAPTLSEPPPPTVESDETETGKRGSRRRQKVLDRPVNQLRPYEVALASALILAVVGGLGFLAYQLYAQPKDGPAADAGSDADRQVVETDPFPLPTIVDRTEKPRPKRLMGAWDLRADDGRTGRLVLRPDGTLTASSSSGDSPLPDYTGSWYLLAEDGDKYVLEFSKVYGGLDGYRVSLWMTSADAFTLIETVKGGTPMKDYQRFVRAAPAKAP